MEFFKKGNERKSAAGQIDIQMDGFQFNQHNLSFFPEVEDNYPDDSVITVVHDALTNDNRDIIRNGTYIWIDNLLGELNSADQIDDIAVVGPETNQPEKIPIAPLIIRFEILRDKYRKSIDHLVPRP